MRVQEVMTSDPACCTPETDLQQVARMMAQNDCGAIPVVENDQTKKIIGIITDRDITCRAVAEGQNPFAATVAECMTSPVYTVTMDTDLNECIRSMEEHQVRRMPVQDANGGCCGMVAQADIARRAPEKESGELVKEISKPDPSAMPH